MKKDDGFLDYLHELLEPCGTISTRRMFGGHGVYCDGLFIAIVIDGRLYLKVDADRQARFRAAGSAPFVYESRGKTVEMSYWNVPEEAMDSPDDMRPWAKLAIAAALRKPEVAKAARAAKTRTKSPVKPDP
ncbi:MAG: transcriptional regulator [Gammaproteobacteria bacterium RIFCSPHIGHO2_12_FULL_63_22]|nr:MAG: transcriptional regulator [Gammaproteobacteria bacterium RIFCSPHIGHO2_12_FULL_63_22]